jgi:hypothetical protein
LAWVVAAFGTLKMHWRVVGGDLIDFTYIPSWEAWVIFPIFLVFGILMFIIGIIQQAWDSIKLVTEKLL